ncbi:nitroreductase family protein [Rugamonas sp. FT82W]|uniref:Nitroreductase family protein n=1 Tax=Duganella vulcania TaxID=2692166 RepID=A0A845GE80_9BURK|nr:nitroreductase family protein [Duganella vulcania]MYM91089.1 nitroreductase family protein [Duganella vulcania]
MNIKHLIESRISANRFDTSRALSDADISELVRLATLAPSAYNFQNWRFIAVRTPQAKERLKEVAFGQQKVAEAPVTFIVIGTLDAHAGLPQALKPSVDAGIMPQTVADVWVGMAWHTHPGNPQLQRDEALRSGSLAAMTMMLAAEGMGLASSAMSGFNAAGVKREFNLGEGDVPVMLLSIGYAGAGNWLQKLRKPLQEVMEFA